MPPNKMLGSTESIHIDTPFAKELNRSLFIETKDCLLGPMPIGDFMDEFLPSNRPHPLCPAQRSHGLVDIVSALRQLGLSTLKVVDNHTRTNYQRFVVEGLRPSIVVYTNGSEEKGTDFGEMEFWIEVVSEGDVFNDDGEFVPDMDQGGEIVGQLLSYATAQLSSGFWTHCFSVVVFSNGARLIRWDRAGGVVSERFNVFGDSNPLLEFCQRFDQLHVEQRGHDRSVRRPSQSLMKTAYDALLPTRDPGESLKSFKSRKATISTENLVVFFVKDPETGEQRRFVGSPPRSPILSLQGRCTRGCPVFDPQERMVFYLKDTWRVDSPHTTREGDTYKILNQSGVKHVARFVIHTDVGRQTKADEGASSDIPIDTTSPSDRDESVDAVIHHLNLHETQTDKFFHKPWLKNHRSRALEGYVHYRLVVDRVGRDLTSFGSSREAIRVLMDVITAHGEAYTKAGILHCDISIGNMLITPRGRGLLIDWDLAKSVSGEHNPVTSHTSTWRFMSAALLMHPNYKAHEYSDDLESMLHSMTFLFVRYSETLWPPVRTQIYIKEVFDEMGGDYFYRIGGHRKASELRGDGYIPSSLRFKGREDLATALREISREFACVYNYLPYAERDFVLRGRKTPIIFGKADDLNEAESNIVEGDTGDAKGSNVERQFSEMMTQAEEEEFIAPLFEKARRVNSYENLGKKIRRILARVHRDAVKWDDKPANRVNFPQSNSQFYRRERIEEVLRTQESLDNASVDSSSDRVKTVNPGEPVEDTRESKRSKSLTE